MADPTLINPPGLGFSMTTDGTITSVTGECAAYADLAPGSVVLHTTTAPEPNYLSAWVRQDGTNQLIHMYLGVAGPDFGTEPPPPECPERFRAFYGNGKRWRHRRAGRAPDRVLPAEMNLNQQHRAAWAEVRRLHRAAIRAHPDNGGSTAAFQKAWPIYEIAMRDFLACWKQKPAA
jgi:hypothetical protein